MKTLLKVLLGLVVLGLVAVALIAFVPIQRTPPQQQLAADFTPADGQGAYAARLGDCAACHTAPGGKPFAGGRAIASPFGTIWSTNITSDKENGVGAYTLDEFRAVLYDGVRKDGAHLYPAMPYENYRKLSESDVRALYQYFTKEAAPVAEAAKTTKLDFPFDQRWGIRLWDWAALTTPGFTPRLNDPVLDRGAYLVEGLGHCGACHSPRDKIMAQKGIDATSADFLAGGVIDGFSAPALRGAGSAPQKWSAADLKAYLVSGRNSHSAVTGEMSLVVAESLQYASDDDLDAMVAYLRNVDGKPADDASGKATAADPAADSTVGLAGVDPKTLDATTALLASADPSMPLGPRLYLDNCAACHFVNGKGANEVFPELDGSSLVTAAETKGLIDVILNGARLPSTASRPEALAMPGFGHRLSDEEVATLASFVRGAWSNKAGAVTAEAVAAERNASEN